MTVTIIPFGKYKGLTYEEVLKLNPAYLQWAQENVTGFHLSIEQQCEVRTAAEAQQEIEYARSAGHMSRWSWWEEDVDYDDLDGNHWGEWDHQ